MYRLIPLREDGTQADIRRYFAEYDSMMNYIKERLDKKHEFPTLHLNYNDKIAYVLHSNVHPDTYDFQGKTAQQVMDDGGAHVIPADDRLRAIRDIEALKRRTGDEIVYQVMLVNPGGETEVMYLQEGDKDTGPDTSKSVSKGGRK